MVVTLVSPEGFQQMVFDVTYIFLEMNILYLDIYFVNLKWIEKRATF